MNIIIPMAGEGSRFGYKFKPFLKLDDRMFIEHVLDAFVKYDNIINSYNFIITRKQENDNFFTEKMNKLFSNIKNKIKILIINEPTQGPYQTIIDGIKDRYLENLIICDCDHQINIEPMINLLISDQPLIDNIDTNIKENNKIQNLFNIDYDIIIPTWHIKKEDHKHWGKILIKNGKIETFFEKEEITTKNGEQIFGMIGCYYFKNTNLFNFNKRYINISDFLRDSINLNLKVCNINEAYFFGTPEMTEKYIKQKRCHENIICDIDGVLFHHNPHSNADINENKLIKNCASKLKYWKENNKKIILITSRSKKTKDELIKLLNYYNIIYDELIMGVNPGTRYVINDIKPSNIFTKQAIEININRNEGIDNIDCDEYINNNILIISKLKGGSFSSTYLLSIINSSKSDISNQAESNSQLINDNQKKFVRKQIIKSKETIEHYQKLKRQCEDMKRFHFYNNLLVPKIISEHDSRYDYYYDMEYFENYKQLNKYEKNIQYSICCKVIEDLNKNVYVYKKKLTTNDFMYNFFNEKIWPKLINYEQKMPIFDYLINSKTIYINNKEYYGLRTIFDIINIDYYSPDFICPIHGDLNFENILYDSELNDYKLIDMEGSRYMDTPLFDLGKIFQSLISKYEEWSNIDNLIYNDNNDIECNDNYFKYDKNDILPIVNKFQEVLNNMKEPLDSNKNNINHIINSGIFYMATYFIRFIPFTLKISNQHAIFSMIMAIVWLNNINKN
jgi:hypothetical protein